MPEPDRTVRAAAAFARYAQRAFDKAVKELVDLAWESGDPTVDFVWENDPALDARANAVLRGMSDDLAAKAKALAKDAVRNEAEFLGEEDGEDVDDGWDEATLVFRLDMAGSHLKELLEIWIALAALRHVGRGELRVLVSRYVSNPYAAPLWRGLPQDVLHWGRGYGRNIAERLAVIGQDAIADAARRAEWDAAKEAGAYYYVRRRGSAYDCPECDGLCGYPIPIDVPFQRTHPRCMCKAEYFFQPIP